MSTKKPIINSQNVLFESIGFYGDSFVDFPMKRFTTQEKNDLLTQHSFWNFPNTFYEYVKNSKDKDNDIKWINPMYKFNRNHIYQYNIYDLWTTKLISHSQNKIVYNKGLGGSGPEHMINIQLGLQKSFLQQPIELPEILILVWSESARIYFDPLNLRSELDFLSLKDITFLNKIGTIDLEGKQQANRFLTSYNAKKIWAKLKSIQLFQSHPNLHQQQLARKVFFDQEQYFELLSRRKDIKIINIDCFPNYQSSLIQQDILKNCVWIDNFSLCNFCNYKAEYPDSISGEDNTLTNTFLHIRSQQHHNFLYEKLRQTIVDYSPGVHDWSNWQQEFDNFK